LGGVVLAGGAGRRFGRPKADVRLGERTLVERALALLRPHCGELVVASRADVPLPPLDVRVVHDPDGEQSAIGGLRSALEALDTDDVLVLACDLLVEPAVIERLLAAAGAAAVAVDQHGVQPLCARYRRREALAACRRLIEEGDLRVRRLADLLAATPVATQPGELRNVNTWPDAFAAALDVPPLSDAAAERILLLTREVAHGTERMNGPLASFLVGFAAGRGSDDLDVDAALDEALAAARGLLPPPEPPIS
jgi:molybdopterin-guanine dinucleotide biosynthesis protein A